MLALCIIVGMGFGAMCAGLLVVSQVLHSILAALQAILEESREHTTQLKTANHIKALITPGLTVHKDGSIGFGERHG